jgi:Carboxypeptidase regulatory-like domain
MNTQIRFVVCVACLLVPATVFGQARLTGADLGGVLTDSTGGVLPGAIVTVTNVETNVARSVVSDGNGKYLAPALPPGTYTITVELQGFATKTRRGVVLTLGQAVMVDVTLELSATQEAVTVTADAPLAQVGRTEVSAVVNQRFIDSLPINGRDFISFSVITPGVSTDRTPQQGASATSGLSFTGQRARSNNIMVDGLDNNDPVVGAVRATFSQEAIREFQVLADSYQAEFGKASGGVVNIVTRSGTNELRGNAFFYLRDRRLNAKNYFDKYDVFGTPVELAKAPYHQKQWGATLGGPLRKNRTFYFASFERNDVDDSRLVTIDPAAASLLTSLGFPVETGNVPVTVANSELMVKADHQWNSNHSSVLRTNVADVTRDGVDDYGGSVARSRGTVQLRTDWAVAGTHTDVFSSRFVHEFRSQFAHESQTIRSLDPNCGGECIGEDQGGPTLEITGVASVGRQRFTPQPRRNSRIQLLDTVSYLAGNHQLKAGAEYNRIDSPSGRNGLPLHFGGRYIFSAIPALGLPTALDALRRGVPAAYVQGYGNSDVGLTNGDMSLFAQDDWKLGRLTLKPGVRYQRQMWADYTYQVSDVAGTTFSYPLPHDTNNLAPRVAAAYDINGNGRTSLHGSYGMFYENTYTTVQSVTQIVNGTDGVRTLVLAAPRASIAWAAPGHRLSETQATALLGGPYPSLEISLDPNLKTGVAHQASVGIDRSITPDLSLSINGVYVRGYNQPGTIDYNPVLPASLGASRRPNDLPCSANPAATCVNGGIPGTSASILQYTSFARTWYQGLTFALAKRPTATYQVLVSYTLSKADDTSTDYQSNFIVQSNGRGRNPADKIGLPLGFDPESERGPSTQDQRHRFVVSGVYMLPSDVQLSGIFTGAAGRPFTPLAGADLNGDGNGGAFPSDRARTNPLDEATSVGRNSETAAAQYNVDLRVSRKFKLGRTAAFEAILDVFNVFNRVNFFEDTNQSSFTIFGTGAYPSNPLPTYGKYTLTLPPRQVQLAGKITF